MNSKTIIVIASIVIVSSIVSSSITAVVLQPEESQGSSEEKIIASIPLRERTPTSTPKELTASPKPRVAGAANSAKETSLDASLGIFEGEAGRKNVISAHKVNKTSTSSKESSKTSAKNEDENKCSFNSTDSARQKEIILNEINWAGSFDNSNAEWIELKNISGEELNISGYEILDLAEQIQIKIPKGVRLPAHALYLLKRGEDTLPNLPAPIYSGALSNSKEGIRLFNDNCQLEDEALAEPSWPAGDSKERLTMERRNDLSWQGSEKSGGTPGKPNSKGKMEAGKPSFITPQKNEEEEEPDPNQGIFKGSFSTTTPTATTTTATSTATSTPNSPNVSVGCQAGQININSSSLEELDEITGIGPVTAQNIIDARPFSSLDELDEKVSGIGKVTLEKIIAEGKACVAL